MVKGCYLLVCWRKLPGLLQVLWPDSAQKSIRRGRTRVTMAARSNGPGVIEWVMRLVMYMCSPRMKDRRRVDEPVVVVMLSGRPVLVFVLLIVGEIQPEAMGEVAPSR